MYKKIVIVGLLSLFQFSALAMEYVEICNEKTECKRFSRLVMGTDHLIQADWQGNGSPEINERELFDILDESVNLGINFYDTSPIYVGSIEYKLGRWLKDRKKLLQNGYFKLDSKKNPDKSLYTLSKGGFPYDIYWSKKLESGVHSEELISTLMFYGALDENQHGFNGIDLLTTSPGTYASRLFGSNEQIQSRLFEELKHTRDNLKSEITVYLMHRDDADFVNFVELKRPQTSIERILRILSSEELASNFWSIGWSNWRSKRINKSLEIVKSNPALKRPVINSPYFSLFEMSERSIHVGGIQVTHKEMMDPVFQEGIKIMSYSPLGGFSILDKPEPRWENAKKAAKEKFDNGDPYWKNVYHAIFTNENEMRYYRAVKFTENFNSKYETNYTVDQMLNAYVLAHPRVNLLVIGPVNIEQLRRSVGSLDLAKRLRFEDLEYLYSGKK